MTRYNALVTSIGGDLGKAVCKALKYSPYDIKIFGTDCRNYVPHPLFCDRFDIIPKAIDKEYINFLHDFSLDNDIDIIYFCSEQELFLVCDNFSYISNEIKNIMAIQESDIINVCRDKYKTVEFLKDNKFTYPNSSLLSTSSNINELLADFQYPFVVKKVSGCGSKYFNIVSDFKELMNIEDIDNNYMIQEYINGKEYTNAVYRDYFNNLTYVITLERTLKDGMSDEVKVVFDEKIEDLCINVAEKLNIKGSINIQMRKNEKGVPMIFEINPRYSSTAFMRARFGFNDVFYAFENIVLKKSISAPKIIKGEAYRYITEYYKFY